MKPLLSVTDHLVFAAPDLQQGIRAVEALTGVTAAVGGHHPLWRTRNALLALGPRLYLEVVGPDSTPSDAANARPFGIDTLKAPRLVTWAVRSEALEETVSASTDVGVDLGSVQQGSRTTPGGTVLRWRMTDLAKHREHGAVPFFIDWGDTPHPALGAPPGCILEGLRISHPDAERITHILGRLGVALVAEKGPLALGAMILSPLGRVALG